MALTDDRHVARFFALIPCAGSGSRIGAGIAKQYRRLAGQPMVLHTLAAFAAVERVADLLVVVAPGDESFEAFSAPYPTADCGGVSRAETVRNGLDRLFEMGADRRDWVLVHDAARCLITPELIDRVIDACEHDETGGLLALPLADTLKRSDADGRVMQTLDRAGCWLAQTPQMFRLGPLLDALAACGDQVTDEASAMEQFGYRPLLVAGSAQNFKVTHPGDFELAESLLQARMGAALPAPVDLTGLRIGEGWDTHALVPGRRLMLGGIEIEHPAGLLGHSDADALLHALIDALIGAAGLGDIGRHFPDHHPRFAGADSIELLQQAAATVRQAGYAIGNVDSTIVAQAPRLAPHIPAMRMRIASALGLEPDRVNVKAKTAERLGPVGQGTAIEARAVVLLQRQRAAG